MTFVHERWERLTASIEHRPGHSNDQSRPLDSLEQLPRQPATRMFLHNHSGMLPLLRPLLCYTTSYSGLNLVGGVHFLDPSARHRLVRFSSPLALPSVPLSASTVSTIALGLSWMSGAHPSLCTPTRPLRGPTVATTTIVIILHFRTVLVLIVTKRFCVESDL